MTHANIVCIVIEFIVATTLFVRDSLASKGLGFSRSQVIVIDHPASFSVGLPKSLLDAYDDGFAEGGSRGQ